MFTRLTVSAALCLSACYATPDEADQNVGSRQFASELHIHEHLRTFDSDPVALLQIIVPADSVTDYVPPPYELLRIPGAADGRDGAMLWMFSGQLKNVSTDGKEVGDNLGVHAALQIEEPPPPPGQSHVPGAAHIYDVRLIFSNTKVHSWMTSKLGEPADHSSHMTSTQADPGISRGVIHMDVGGDPGTGGFTYQAEYGALAPAVTVPAVYTWHEGPKGLSWSEAEFTDIMASNALGHVCAQEDSWVREILGAECRSGGGLALEMHAEISWKVFHGHEHD